MHTREPEFSTTSYEHNWWTPYLLQIDSATIYQQGVLTYKLFAQTIARIA